MILFTMFEIKLPSLETKLAYDIPITDKQTQQALVGRVLDLTDSLGTKIKVWKKLSSQKILCKPLKDSDTTQYVFEIENLKGTNDIVTALNKWMHAKEECTKEEYQGKEVRFVEKVFFNNPRLYEIRFNNELFKLNLRFAKLTEMGREQVLVRKKQVKRNAKIKTVLVNEWYLDTMTNFDYEKTLESNREIAEKLVDKIVQMAVDTELNPPKPIEPPFYFRLAEIRKIWDHMTKLTKDRGRETWDLLALDTLNDFLSDNFDEVITIKERKEILAKMKRKVRKIARQFYAEQSETE